MRSGRQGAPAQGMCIVFASTFLQRLRGLLGRDPFWLGTKGALLIAPCDSIHTWGMRYAIDVAFLDRRGRVLKSELLLPPRRHLRCPGAHAVLERPAVSPAGSSRALPSGASGRWPEEGERIFFSACCQDAVP